MVTSIESNNFFHKKWTMISRMSNYITTCIWLVSVCIQPAFVIEYIDCVSELLSCISKRNVNAGNLSSNNCYHHYIINSIPMMFFVVVVDMFIYCTSVSTCFLIGQFNRLYFTVQSAKLWSLFESKSSTSTPCVWTRGMIDILLTLFS